MSKLKKKGMNIFLHNKCSITSGIAKKFWETVKAVISNESVNINDKILIWTNDNVITQDSCLCFE